MYVLPSQTMDLEASFEGDDLVVPLDSKAIYAVHNALDRYASRHCIKFFSPIHDIGVGQYEDEDPYTPRPDVERSHRVLRVRKDEDSPGGKLSLFWFRELKPKVRQEIIDTLLEGRIKLIIKDGTQAEVTHQP